VKPHDILKEKKKKKRLGKGCVMRHGVHQLQSFFISFDIPPDLLEHAK
jgi:hypothetical protein